MPRRLSDSRRGKLIFRLASRGLKTCLGSVIENWMPSARRLRSLEDATYLYYEQGFDEALAQVKYFAGESSVDLSRIDREKKLQEMLVERVSTDRQE